MLFFILLCFLSFLYDKTKHFTDLVIGTAYSPIVKSISLRCNCSRTFNKIVVKKHYYHNVFIKNLPYTLPAQKRKHNDLLNVNHAFIRSKRLNPC